MFFIGMRYGRAQYSERVLYSIAPELFPTVQQAASNPDAAAGWIELTTGLRVKVWRGFWMGYTWQNEIFTPYQKYSGFESYDIPGFGLPFKDCTGGLTTRCFGAYRLRGAE
jgi:hypothetical protein